MSAKPEHFPNKFYYPSYSFCYRQRNSIYTGLRGSGLFIPDYIFASSGLYQCTSINEGATWSAPAIINVGGATERNVPELYYQASENRLVLLFQNRSNGYLEASFGDPTAVFASATVWQALVLYYFNNQSGSAFLPGLGNSIHYG